MVLATLVRFDTRFGYTVATQLAFVPLLFALPLALVPLTAATAAALAQVPEALTGNSRASRLLVVVGNSWFSIGPVAVFVIAGVAPRQAGPVL